MSNPVEQAPERVSGVLEPLETVAGRGFERHSVFRDWTSLMLAALQRDDDQYLGILEKYDRGNDRDVGKRNADLFAAAFGQLQKAMADSGRDVLGEAYEAWGMQSSEFGQHFTPHSVVRAMVEIQATVEDTDPPVTNSDPACGSGRMLVLAARHHDVATVCVGRDKDEVCAQMAALNLCFFNVTGEIVYGDSLALEEWRAWRTTHSPAGGTVTEVEPEDAQLAAAADAARAGGDD